MYRIAFALLVPLTSCDRQDKFDHAPTMVEVVKQGAEIDDLKAEVRRLKVEQDRDHALLMATRSSLEEARDNHRRLRDEFKNTLDLRNKRNEEIESRLDEADGRR